MEASRLSSREAFSLEAARVALVGAGRVGQAFGRALAARGHPVVAVASRSGTPPAPLGAPRAATPRDAARDADLVVVAVPDDALEAVIAGLAPGVREDAWVVHTCGLQGAAVLAPCGERVAAVHPARPIPSGEAPLDGIAFGVTCSDAAWPFAAWLARELGGMPVRIPEESRALYHAALVIASNFTTSLAGDAMDLAGREVVLPLLRATIDNLERMDPGAALTGPVVRGDAGTIRAHLNALDGGGLRDAYVANSRRLVERAVAAGRLDPKAAAAIEAALAEAGR